MKRTTAFNVLNALTNGRIDLDNGIPTQLRDVVGGNSRWKGTFEFKLIDPVTGAVERQREVNQTVDQGENALLQFLAGITDNQTVTFDGDGSTTAFDIPEPYHPIRNVVDVSVGGTSQTVGDDYAVDYYSGTLVFDSNSVPGSGTDNISIEVDYYTNPWEWLAVGTDGTAVADGDTSLGSESTRIGLDSGYYTRDESAVEVTGQWTFGTSEANVSIAEAGLFNVPASANVDGDMLNRTVVDPTIDKTSSQELQVTWTLSMS